MQSKHRHTEKGTAYSNTRLYKVWCSMKGRCNTPSHTAYKNYGARGITVCKEWAEDFGAFMDWAMQTGYDEEAPRGKYTLERIDTNGPYSPENCCWKTIQEQERNKSTTIYVEDNGERVCRAEYCERHGIDYKSELYRVSTKERESVKERVAKKRRAKGMLPRKEYLAERQKKSDEAMRKYLDEKEKHPDLSNRKLAAIMGISEAGIRRLKKKAELWHN